MPELLAGWAKAEIPVRVGQPMAGYVARRGTSRGMLDRLYVRALVLQQGQLRLAIVVADLLLLSNRWVARLRPWLARLLETKPEHIILAATHTHSGPLVDTSPFPFAASSGMQKGTQSFQQAIEASASRAVWEAGEMLRPSRLSVARVPIRGVATDRNHPTRFRVQPFYLLRLASARGEALLGIYGCHPTVLGANNLRLSGDLHGEIARQMEHEFEIALIGNGAGANISTRFSRREQTSEEISRLAKLIERQVRAASGRLLSEVALHCVSRALALPVRRFPAHIPEPTQARGRLAVVAAEARATLHRLRRSTVFARRGIKARVTAIRLGPLSLIALPFEIYADTGEFFWRQARAIPLCYTNGYWGYLPSAAAGPDDYEAISSPFDWRADLQLRAAVLKMAACAPRRAETA